MPRPLSLLSLAAPSLFHLTGQHGGANDLNVLTAKAALEEAEASGEIVAVDEAKLVLADAKTKAKKTSAAKAAGGGYSRPSLPPPRPR